MEFGASYIRDSTVDQILFSLVIPHGACDASNQDYGGFQGCQPTDTLDGNSLHDNFDGFVQRLQYLQCVNNGDTAVLQ